MRHKAAKFLLKLREGYKVFQVALLDIINTFSDMWAEAHKCMQQRLIQAGVDPLIMENLPICQMPFDGVDTIYQFEKFCVENFDCLVS